jgi:Flp pilus assembly protein TadB
VIEATILASGLAAGADGRKVLLAAAAIWAPLLLALGLAFHYGFALARPSAGAGPEVMFAETVVGELRAGASLRSALRTACAGREGTDAIVRRLDVGEPLPQAVRGMSAGLPSIGGLVEAVLVSGSDGGRMLPVFEELLIHAAAEEAVAAEMRTALAPVRASMTVLVGGPVGYLAWSLVSGRFGRLIALPGGLWLTVIGATLFVAGIVTMLVLARRRK